MRAIAFSIHLLTAFGAVLALLALIAAGRGDWSAMFLALGLALIIDAIDGPLARHLGVKEQQPRWSGATLDLIVDYATYVFVPAYAIAVSGLIATPLAVLAGAVIVLTGALYFADEEMKTSDNYFRGFPAVWNLVAFYLLLLRPGEWIAVTVILVLAVLTFVPLRFVHPFRVVWLRPLSIALVAVWAILALITVAYDLQPGIWVSTSICLIGAYFLVIGWLPSRV